MEESSYRNSQRSSDAAGNLPIFEYQHHGISLSPSQVQQHLLMSQQSPPIQIQTSPSYASTTRSVSNRSVVSHNIPSFRIHSPATYEAERIAVATSQAKAAARSILLAGGTQASALSTAKAAAKSALQTDLVPGEKPPLGVSQKGGFRNRRKSKQKAEIIASMALSAANDSCGLGIMGGEIMMSRSRSGFPMDRGDSDFPDDYTNLQSLGPSTIYGVTPPVFSPLVELQRLQSDANQCSNDEKQNIYRPVQTQGGNQVFASHQVSPACNTKNDTVPDQNNLNPTEITGLTKKKDEKVPLTRTLSIKEFFQRKQHSDEKDTTQSSLDEVKTKIPSEMPMPRSTHSMKGSNSVKGRNQRNSTEIVNGSPQSRQKQTESQLSSYSDCSISHTNSSAHSYGESTYENTAEYTNDTYESTIMDANREASTSISVDTKTNSGSFFFGNMDPFVTTFSEVFSCTPEPKSTKQFLNDNSFPKKCQARDEKDISARRSSQVEDERDQPFPNSGYGGRTSINQVESDSLLQGINIRSFEEANENKKNNQSSMEQMVLKALLAISPKSSPTKRPKLNISHTKLASSSMKDAHKNNPQTMPAKSGRKKQRSSFFAGSEARASLSKSSSSKEKVAEANSSNQQESSGEDYSSGSEDSVTANPAPMNEEEGGGYKLRRFSSWFHRPKKSIE
jgi:hypothetical protein